MRKQKSFIGRLVKLRPESFTRLLLQKHLQKSALENIFLVCAAIRRNGRLVCYGGSHRILVSLTEVVLV